MIENCEIDVDVDESKGISNTEETVNETKEDSIVQESKEPAKKKTGRRRVITKINLFAWKTFKNIVFLMCLSFLIIQSVEFCDIYYKYPTTIQTEITVSKEFKLPAITLCFKNT
ncbi:unnamed protein product [Larinioides sclopetarius]|uniref:Uncharacterized protein n=1 Tax=Larinioides sclopetarius TaxID=280406 RepID=A0AAV2BF14_9ARAC